MSSKGTYSRFNIRVDPLQIDQKNLNTKRMMDLMAVGQGDGSMPLYMHTVKRILREMRLLQQATGAGFDYPEFKRKVLDAGLTPGQLEPLKQRLDTLESFMPQSQVGVLHKYKGASQVGSEWDSVVRRLLHIVFNYMLRSLAWSSDYCRSLVSLYIPGNCMFIVQCMPEHIPGTGCRYWTCGGLG